MPRASVRTLGYRVIGRRLIQVAALVASPLIISGCGAVMLARLDAIAVDQSSEAVYRSASTRDEVEAKRGKADTSRPLPDGSRLDRYTYTIRNPEWRMMKWHWALGTVITAGFTEAGWVPWAGIEALRHRRSAIVMYDTDGRVVGHGTPPTYGAPDESVGVRSLNDIRERCRAEHVREPLDGSSDRTPQVRLPYTYDQCVVRRVTIWGIE